jgi:hypothetical protein
MTARQCPGEAKRTDLLAGEATRGAIAIVEFSFITRIQVSLRCLPPMVQSQIANADLTTTVDRET